MLDENQDWYYQFARKDIAPLLPEKAPEVLEVGCGGGGTLAWLKNSGIAKRISGIEINPEAAAIAAGRVDALFEGDADARLNQLAPESFDLILCLDVLKNLVDPWATLSRINKLLKPGGKILVSLPNITDRSHLRFLTGKSAMNLLDEAGFCNVTTLSFQYLFSAQKPATALPA